MLSIEQNTPTMNANSTLTTDGNDSSGVANKRKRYVVNVDALGVQFSDVDLGTASELDDAANGGASLSTVPDSVLLHIFCFVLVKDQVSVDRDSSTLQLALEKTCRKFSAFLGKDSTMKLLYQPQKEDFEFDYRVENLREKLFIVNGSRMIKRFQISTENQICARLGGADGVRHVVASMLTKMEQPCERDLVFGSGGILTPPQFPENGFKLFLRGDSIAYLTEVIEQHMVYRLSSALSAAMFRSNPKGSHPYPVVCPNDILFVDSIRISDFGAFRGCVLSRHQSPSHSCSKLSLGDTPKMWHWPDHNCMDEGIIGTEQLHRMVRAIASCAGIVKLTGGTFDCIAAEILHFMAVIVTDAFEASKSLWCPHADVGDDFTGNGRMSVAIDDEIIGDEESDDTSTDSYLESNHFANHPPTVTVDEDGRYVCVIIPRQIKDAAVRIGMTPLLDSQSWEVSEGRTKKEEVREAMSLYEYELSSDDESSSSEGDSDSESIWVPNSAEEAAIDRELEELRSAEQHHYATQQLPLRYYENPIFR